MIPSVEELKAGGNVPRFHGDGMIQLYLSKRVRLHVYHPDFPATVDNALIHDHAWDMYSEVMLGRVPHKTYRMDLTASGNMMLHEARGGGGAGLIPRHQCFLKNTGINIFVAGSSYFFPRHEFHETLVSELSMTRITKSRIGALPCRVICPNGETPDDAYAEGGPSISDMWDAILEAHTRWAVMM